MRKQFLYLFLVLAFVSCSDEVKFNNPTFEGQKDNVFWRAVDSKASISTGGFLTIEASSKNEVITLKTTTANPGNYSLGASTIKMVSYVKKDANGTVTFSTGIGRGNGVIVIEEYDAVNKTVTGTFKFNAVNDNTISSAGPILNFQHGHFYKIPIVSTSLITTLPTTP
jgi:Family of unknown function (DUF6252)